MNYLEIEQVIRAGYRQVTRRYRHDDEIEVNTENHRHLGEILKQVCRSFPHPMTVLDVGCGTGRYFHCLENVALLVGLDISEEMLHEAQSPVLQQEMACPNLRLVRGNAHLVAFPPASFHFIYSLGMFGFGCPVTVDICNRFHDWLVPGGKLLFNVVDSSGLRLASRIRRQIRGLVYPMLPLPWRRRLDERQKRSPFFGMTRRQLTEVLAGSKFSEFQIDSRVCRSPLWQGRHLECLAQRSGYNTRVPMSPQVVARN